MIEEKAEYVFILRSRLTGRLFDGISIVTDTHKTLKAPTNRVLPFTRADIKTNDLLHDFAEITKEYNGVGLNCLREEIKKDILKAALKIGSTLNTYLSFLTIRGISIFIVNQEGQTLRKVRLFINATTGSEIKNLNLNFQFTPFLSIGATLVPNDYIPLMLSISDSLLFQINDQVVVMNPPTKIDPNEAYTICSKVNVYSINQTGKDISRALPLDKKTGEPVRNIKDTKDTEDENSQVTGGLRKFESDDCTNHGFFTRSVGT